MSNYIIISSSNCQWCDKAKAALNERGLTYVEFSTLEPTVRHLFFALNVKTVPQIFRAAHGNHPVEYIGGHDDLIRHLAVDEFPINPY